MVGCYAQRDEIDRLAYLGVVHIVQEKVIQIRLRVDYKVLDKIPTSREELRNIVVRPVIPITAIDQFYTLENENE